MAEAFAMLAHVSRATYRSLPIQGAASNWLQGLDLHQRSLGYEPDEMLLLYRC